MVMTRLGGSSRFASTLLLALLLPLLATCGGTPAAQNSTPATQNPAGASAVTAAPTTSLSGIHKIQHVVIIMQENRSFDSYFGTYPGADGIPMQHGVPAICVPDPERHQCLKPFHDMQLRNYGGPHGAPAAIADIDGGKMDGFVVQAILSRKNLRCGQQFDPNCQPAGQPNDTMGYHDAHEIPNYWTYAQNFVLQDHMFASSASWSLPAHLFLVSEWSAKCAQLGDPMSCTNELQYLDSLGTPEKPGESAKRPDYAWTDLTYLLHLHKVSWKYYLAEGSQPDCEDDSMICVPKPQLVGTPQIWNPLPYFDTVHQDGELGNIQTLDHFYSDASNGALPAVSWIVPNAEFSEHPPALLSKGHAYVTKLINTIMQGPNWDSTAIFLSWDDWGGFYDHVTPPKIDRNGYGLRVPGLVISPYAKKGYIDHQILSHDAYVKFIEDDFLGGQRINPKTDGRPDPRPDVREYVQVLGNLVQDFDFTQPPRPPLVLATNLPPAPASADN